MVRRTAKAALTLAAVVGLVTALTGVAGATPKPTPSPSPPPPTATYTITDLGSLGYGVSRALAINNNGQVTGYSYTGATVPEPGTCCADCYTNHKKLCVAHLYHAFLWSNGTMTDLGTLGGNYSQGLAINLPGEVVGWAQTKAGPSDSFLWDGKTMVDLGSAFRVYGINDSGQMAGACTTSTSSYPCVDSNGKVTALTDPPNLSCSGAIAINNNGQVLGNCGDSSGNGHAVVWTNGTPTVLPTLGGPYMAPAAINNLGQVTGFGQTSTYAQHGFLWSNGQMTDLGNNFFAAAFNDNGVIVGNDMIYSGGTLQNLNNLKPAGSGYSIQNATGIYDKCQIVADAYNSIYQTRVLLLTPS